MSRRACTWGPHTGHHQPPPVDPAASAGVGAVAAVVAAAAVSAAVRTKPNTATPPPSPPEPPTPYQTFKRLFFAPSEYLLTRHLRRKLEEEVGLTVGGQAGFPGVLAMFHALNRANRRPEELQAAGHRVLLSLFPGSFLRAFRRFLASVPGGGGGWFSARHAAALMTMPPVLEWLVGECRVDNARPDEWSGPSDPVPVNTLESLTGRATGPPGYRQVGVVTRCRVLEEAGCAAICLNGCKVPTERMFAEEFGLPVTLRPNFQTKECRFVFGAAPPPLPHDPSFAQPCVALCGSARYPGSPLPLGPDRAPPPPRAACAPGALAAAAITAAAIAAPPSCSLPTAVAPPPHPPDPPAPAGSPPAPH